jgi:methylenetetrahydrofolate dehydrogenase (NADP+)/methenyltetrahydrofolate cyclohydrolase
METRILAGKPIAALLMADVAERAAALAGRGEPVRLAVLAIGDDPASGMYCASIGRAASSAGIAVELVERGATSGALEVARTIRALSDDPGVAGVLVQQPLPPGIPASVIDELSPAKDVDGATARSLGLLAAGRESFAPCTAQAVVEILVGSGISIPGKHVVIVGRSAVVGRPLAALLLRKSPRGNATVTVCHTGTPDLGRYTRLADIVVAAMGRPRAVTADMIAEGAVVVDVGTNRIADPSAPGGSRVVGDTAFDEMLGKAAAVTPVPGGVGSLTTALLLLNTVVAAERGPRSEG